VVTILFFLYFGDYIKQRILGGFCSLAIAQIGMILIVGKSYQIVLMIALPQSNRQGRLAGFYLTQSYATAFVVLLSLISSNVAGYTKKTTVSALYLIGYCFFPIVSRLTLGIGNLIGPQVFQPEDAPEYRPAEITILICWTINLALLLVVRQINVSRNKEKERLTSAPEYHKVLNGEFLDLTDMENPGMSRRVMM
jgi:MFS transporter, ACS family, DAL5 transporter family protein